MTDGSESRPYLLPFPVNFLNTATNLPTYSGFFISKTQSLAGTFQPDDPARAPFA